MQLDNFEQVLLGDHHLQSFYPGDFVTKVKQINSQSDLISMSSFTGHVLTHNQILVFSIFTMPAKLDLIVDLENFTKVHFISMKK